MKIIYKRKERKLENNPIKSYDSIIIAKLTKKDFLDENINHEYRIIRYLEIDDSSILFYGYENKQNDYPVNCYLGMQNLITKEVFINEDEYNSVIDLIDSYRDLPSLPNEIDDTITRFDNSYYEFYFKGQTFEKTVKGLNIGKTSFKEFDKQKRNILKTNNQKLIDYINNEERLLTIISEVEEIIKRKLYQA